MTLWTQDIRGLNLDIDTNHHKLLTKPGKLTNVLQQLCSTLTLKLIKQHLGTATLEEQKLLNINETNSFIREIFLCGDGTPWVHARVVITNHTYTQYAQVLDNLGTKFIGEHFLYQQPDLTYSSFSYTTINKQPARRRIFYTAQQPILITEIFLPNIPQLVQAE